ncbi:FecR family protein [Pedobacter heparinus]|uniref:FecR family protein n=1 Tax=Pedobacter heparinus TaxID=984 RepID=UPI00292E2212|nr:FecR domain-containing protein [Pedobacter heparinus]
MDNKEAKLLLLKYESGDCTAEEIQLLESWFLKIKSEQGPGNLKEHELNTDLGQVWNELSKQLGRKPVELWPRIAGVAAAVAAITLGIWLYYAPGLFGGRHPEFISGSPLANDIAPGKNTATITLPDGTAIPLSDKQSGVIIDAANLKYNDGTIIDPLSSRANAKDPSGLGMLTVTTPRGGTYQVTLPDGTKVWLNAASRLTYTMPLNERGGVRLVELSGEAYFEVFRNKNQPFVVTTRNLTTTVLGTHFNISAYDDDPGTRTTLLEGSVRVVSLTPLGRGGVAGEGPVTLKPNQQATITSASGIAVKEVDANDYVLWKNGKFSFTSEEMGAVLRQVARWYNVDILYRDQVQGKKVTGSVSRFAQVSKLLEILETTGGVHFKIEGKTIVVSK